MTAHTPKPNRLARRTLCIGLAAIALLVAHLADRAALLRIHYPNALNADWGRMLRIAGYVPTWLLIAAAFALIDYRLPRASFTFPLRDRWSRAATLISSVLLAGLLAEILKALIRRERPNIDITTYVFRPFSENPWSTSGLGMPSGHTAIAFGAAAMLCRLHPRAWPVWLAIAGGCGITRILARAHFLSDVVAGALVGLTAGAIIWSLHLRVMRRPRVAP